MKLSSRLRIAFIVAAGLMASVGTLRADMVNIEATGPQSGSFLGTPISTSYNAVLSYDDSELASGGSYPVTLSVDGTTESGTLTITSNTLDPSNQPADEIDVEGSSIVGPGFFETDSLLVYLPAGSLSGLPTANEWQTLLGGSYSANASGEIGIPAPPPGSGIFALGSYTAPAVTLSVQPSTAVPAPAAAEGALPLVALCAWIKRRSPRK